MFTNAVVMVVYFVLTIIIGMYVGQRKTEKSADFTVAGRSIGGFVMFFTLLATIVGASSVMGYTAWYAKRGISQFWFTVGSTICYLLYLFYLGPRINQFGREHGGETVGDWILYRYGKTARLLASVLIAVAYIAITAFQYLAMATILNVATGLNFKISMAITAIIVVLYTASGGLWAVVSTDVLQGFMTLVGVIIMVPIFTGKAGGISQVIARLPAAHLQVFGHVSPWNAFASMLTLGLGIVSWPDMWQRMYAAKSIPTLKKSNAWYIVANLVINFSVMFIGFAAIVLMPHYKGSTNAMLPAMIVQYLPNVLGGVLLAALIAVIMGTSDSVLLVSAIIIEKDLVSPFLKKERTDKQKLFLTKVITAVTGVATLGVLYFSTDMFDLWVMSADITGATLAAPILLGFIWKKPGEAATLASIVFGFAGWLFFTLIERNIISVGLPVSISPILPGAILSFLAYIIFAFIKPAKETAKV